MYYFPGSHNVVSVLTVPPLDSWIPWLRRSRQGRSTILRPSFLVLCPDDNRHCDADRAWPRRSGSASIAPTAHGPPSAGRRTWGRRGNPGGSLRRGRGCWRQHGHHQWRGNRTTMSDRARQRWRRRSGPVATSHRGWLGWSCCQRRICGMTSVAWRYQRWWSWRQVRERRWVRRRNTGLDPAWQSNC